MRTAHILMLALTAGCIPAQAAIITWDNATGDSRWDGTSANWYREERVDDHWVRYHMAFSENDMVRFTGEGAGSVVLGETLINAEDMRVSGNADYTFTGSGLKLRVMEKTGSGTLTIANKSLEVWGGIDYALLMKGGTLDIAETVEDFSIGSGRKVVLQGGTLLLHGREVNPQNDYEFMVDGEVGIDAATITNLQGTGTLVKISDGTLTLKERCHVGTIRLEQGTLCIADSRVLEGSITKMELQGGALDLAGCEFGSDLTLLSGSTATINSGTISGQIRGDGSLIKVGDGTLVIGYAKDDQYNSYYGDTVVNGGVLKAATDYAFGTTRQCITVNAGELDLGGHMVLNPLLAKCDTTLHSNGGTMVTLAPDACRLDIEGDLSVLNVMMQDAILHTGMDLTGGGEIRVKKGDTLSLVVEKKDDDEEEEDRSKFIETASIRVRGEAEHAVLHNVNLFVDTHGLDAALILGASPETSCVDHLDFRSETGIRLMYLTIGNDCSFTAGTPDAITLNEVTIDISDSFRQISETEYCFDLTGLFHCDLDMKNVYLDATDLNLNLADATVQLDFGEQVNITRADSLRLGMKGYDTELTLVQGGTLTFKATVQTPEPATGTLALLALAGLAARRRRPAA